MNVYNKKGYYDDDDLEDLSNYDRLQRFGHEEATDDSNSERIKEAVKREQETTVFQELLSYIKLLFIAAVIALIINKFVIVNAEVPTGSMLNTIMIGDRLIGFRLAYLFSKPERGDVVIFKYPDDESQNFVKRLIGLPNETVEIRNGIVYVNSTPLDEPYLREPMIGSWGPYILGEDEYFFLGDNRNDSKDSRFWTHTYVNKKQILAKAVFVYFSDKWLTFKLLK